MWMIMMTLMVTVETEMIIITHRNSALLFIATEQFCSKLTLCLRSNQLAAQNVKSQVPERKPCVSVSFFLMFQLVLLVLKEVYRAKSILKGVEMASPNYSDAWLVMIAIGTAKGENILNYNLHTIQVFLRKCFQIQWINRGRQRRLC